MGEIATCHIFNDNGTSSICDGKATRTNAPSERFADRNIGKENVGGRHTRDINDHVSLGKNFQNRFETKNKSLDDNNIDGLISSSLGIAASIGTIGALISGGILVSPFLAFTAAFAFPALFINTFNFTQAYSGKYNKKNADQMSLAYDNIKLGTYILSDIIGKNSTNSLENANKVRSYINQYKFVKNYGRTTTGSLERYRKTISQINGIKEIGGKNSIIDYPHSKISSSMLP